MLFRLKLLFCFSLLLFFSCGKTPSSIDIPFTELATPVESDLFGMVFINEMEGYFCGGKQFQLGLVISTFDGGDTWSVDTLGTQKMKAIAATDNQILIAGDGGQLFASDRQNNSPWQRINLPTFANFNALAPNGDDIWLGSGVAFREGRIFQVDSDLMLTLRDSIEPEINGLAAISGQTIFSAGYGTIRISRDGGLTWQATEAQGDFFRAIHFPTEETGYAVGQIGYILRTRNGGVNWEQIRDPSKAKVARVTLRAVHFQNAMKGCVVGENGTLWLTSNGGDSWNQIANVPKIDFFAVQLIDDVGYVAGEDGRLFRFELP